MDMESVLAGLVRVGIVTDVDRKKRMARVKFQSEDMTSGWLYVLQHYETGIAVKKDGGHSHKIDEAGAHSHPGSTGYQAVRLNITEDGAHAHAMEEAPDHEHKGTVTTWWTPKVNDRVVCLYLPVFNGDGFILGTV